MTYLKVGTGHTLGELLEEGNHDFLELGRFDDVKNLLKFVQEHHLFRTVDFGPEF